MKIRALCVITILFVSGCSQSTTVEPEAMGPEGPQDLQPPVATVDRPDDIDLTEPGSFQRSVAEATIIDTAKWEKQIARIEPFEGESISSSSFRPVKRGKPVIPPGPVNGLVPGGISNAQRVNPGALFPGITRSPWNPPDPALGVGPNHIIETVNMELAFFTKSGTMQFQQRLDSTGNPGFFEEVGGGDFCFDPKCFYDHYANRFVVLALEVYSSIDESYITIAVSDDDDPNGIWYKYRTWAVVQVGNSTYWVDYPGLGYDENGYYITSNLFLLSGNGNGFGGVIMRAFDKTPMLSGQPVSFNDLRDGTTSSAQVTQNFGVNAAPYIVSRSSSSELKVSAINDPLGSPSLISSFVDVPSSFGGPSAPNNGGSISTLTERLMNVCCRDGRLWACHSVGTSNGNRTVARWYEVELGDWPNSGPDPTMVQSGEIDLGSSQFTFFPAIYTNSNGSTGMVFANSSNSEFASVKGVGRLSDDPLGTMSAPVEFIVGDTAANGRWGDYFDIALDPTDGLTFWVVGEYMSPQGWRTTINSFFIEQKLAITSDSFAVNTGSANSGGLPELADSDDQYVVLDPEFLLFRYQLQFTVDATSPTDLPTALEFNYESKVFNFVGTVEQDIELYNYDTASFESVDNRLAAVVDTVVTIDPGGDASRFVQAGTGAMQARISYENSLPFWVFSTENLYLPYRARADHVFWSITP